jgi:hypothetical protein
MRTSSITTFTALHRHYTEGIKSMHTAAAAAAANFLTIIINAAESPHADSPSALGHRGHSKQLVDNNFVTQQR